MSSFSIAGCQLKPNTILVAFIPVFTGIHKRAKWIPAYEPLLFDPVTLPRNRYRIILSKFIRGNDKLSRAHHLLTTSECTQLLLPI